MVILGLAGPAGAGKDTVAEYLAKAYGFVKFAFSDPLYHEVQVAYGLPDQDLLRNRATKEVATERLMLDNCGSSAFVEIAMTAINLSDRAFIGDPRLVPLSPRQVLQWWGTDYRRAQDGAYWLKQAAKFVNRLRGLAPYPEQAPQFFVECGTRFENEREFVKNGDRDWGAWSGNVWHIRRDAVAPVNTHASAQPLPVLPGERELWNNDTIERLWHGVDLLLTQNVQFVRVSPMANPVKMPV